MPPPYDHERLLEWGMEVVRWSMAKHEREFSERAFAHYSLYKNWNDSSFDPDAWGSNIGVGLAYPAIKTISARLMAPWQAGDYLITARAIDAESSPSDEKVSAYINDRIFNRMIRMYSKCELANESAVGLGRGILASRIVTRPEHRRLKRVAQQIQSMMGMQVGSTLTWANVPVEQRHDFEYVSPFDWWTIGERRFSQDADLSVERDYLTTYEVYRCLDSGEFLPVEFDEGDALGYDEYTGKRMAGETGRGWRSNITSGSGSEPRVHRRYTLQGWVETGESENGYPHFEPMLVQILDDKHVIKAEPLTTYDSRPGYIVFEPYQDIGANRPIGMIETVEQLLYAINDIVEIGMDNGRKSLESPLAIDPTSVTEPDHRKILFGPAEINWITNPRQSISEFPLKELGPTFDKLMSLLLDLFQRNSGINDSFGGLNTEQSTKYSPGMKTARGFEMMTDLAASRIAPIVQKMDLEMFRTMAKMVHETAKLYLPEKVPVRTAKNPLSPFTMVSPGDLDAMMEYGFNTKALDAALGSRRQEFQEMMAQINEVAASGILSMQGYAIDGYELVRVLGDQYGYAQETSKLVVRIEQLMAQQGLPMAMPGMPGIGGPPMPPGAPMPPRGMNPGMPTPGPAQSRASGLGQSKVA